MAVGWARDGAVQEQIDAGIDDAVSLARSRLNKGKESLSECENCGEDIPLARQKAVPGVRLCVDCQTELEKHQAGPGGINRRGSKDSQLK